MATDDDVVLARALMQAGALTAEQISQCLKIVDQREALQIRKPLAEVIVEIGLMTAEALAPHLTPAPAPAPQDSNAVPEEIGGFKLIRRIGEGALGTVWLAEQISLSKHVAVKVLKPELAGRKDLVDGFLREARADAALVHPRVVQAITAGEDKGVYYFAMEYVPGRNLREILAQRGHLDEREALSIARKIAEGLAAAARCGLVHRDIKPANILVCADGTVKIADFGLAHPPSVVAPGWGTPDYMAPEQVTGQERVDARTDLYALGATLFHLLTGRPPFAASNVKDVMLARLSQPAPDVRAIKPEISPRTAALVARLLAREPRNRCQLPQEVLDEIAVILEPPSAPQPVPRPAPGARVRAPSHRGPAPRRPQAPRRDSEEDKESAPVAAPPRPRQFTTIGIIAGVAVAILAVALELRARSSPEKAQYVAGVKAAERAKQQEKMQQWFRDEHEVIARDFAKAFADLRGRTGMTVEARAQGFQDLLVRYPTARGIEEAARELEAARAAVHTSGVEAGKAQEEAGAAEARAQALLGQGQPYKANEFLVNLKEDVKSKLGPRYRKLINECAIAIDALAQEASAKGRALAAAGKREEARAILEEAALRVDENTRKELTALIEELCGKQD